MQALLDAIVDLASLVSPSKVRAIASALRGNSAEDIASKANLLAETPAARAAIVRILSAWVGSGVSGHEVAGMLIGASEARARAGRESSTEFVWTGPTTSFVPTRRTEQVLLDLIRTATVDLFLVSFVAYGVPSIVMAINEALSRGVRVRALLERSSGHGGSLDYDPVELMRALVPNVELFAWKAKDESFIGGRVHAKMAVADGERAFITSANLTAYALEKNMEAGVLLHGGPLPKSLIEHLQALIDVGIIGSV